MLPTREPLQSRGGAAARSSAPGDCGYGRRVSTETGAAFPTSGGEGGLKKAPNFSSLHSSFPASELVAPGRRSESLWYVLKSATRQKAVVAGRAPVCPGAWVARSSQASGRQGPGHLTLSKAGNPRAVALTKSRHSSGPQFPPQ